MKKFAMLALLALTGCDPGGAYPKLECKARDIKTGYCTEAIYSCTGATYPMLTHHYPHGPRCM